MTGSLPVSGEGVQRAGGDHEDFFCRGHPDGRGRRLRRVEKVLPIS